MAKDRPFLGIEIGGTKLQIVTGDAKANILERRRFGVDPKKGAAGIRKQIEKTLREILKQARVTAIGVGFGGPADWRTGRICKSHQIEGWSGFDLAGWLKKLSGAPVFVDNDGNVAALGEAHHGAGRGKHPVFYVTLGSGVGGGLVVEGNIYHGATPGEAEIGHVRLDRSGTIVEERCSGWAVDARIRSLKAKNPKSRLSQLIGTKRGGEAKHLAEALRLGDAAAKKLLLEIADDLAFGLSHVTQLFHPEVIVIGGGLSQVGKPLRAAVEKALRGYTMEAFAPGPRLKLSRLGEDAVPVGALELARGNCAE